MLPSSSTKSPTKYTDSGGYDLIYPDTDYYAVNLIMQKSQQKDVGFGEEPVF